jgi:hypothetical protein
LPSVFDVDEAAQAKDFTADDMTGFEFEPGWLFPVSPGPWPLQ